MEREVKRLEQFRRLRKEIRGTQDYLVVGIDISKGTHNALMRTTPGKILNLTASTAPSASAAAEYYPAIYWYAMLKVPEKSEFPGTGPDGNGIPPALKSQAQWLDIVKTNGCYTCHQLGNKATRTIPKELGEFKSSAEAWQRRIQSGQAMIQMTTNIGRLDAPRALKWFAEWTDRIAAGELPSSQPSRPQGVERNVVITLWDWAGPKDYLHDEVSTDKRNPRVNANGPIYGAPSTLALNMVDASAILWRLHLGGADVGDRWQKLAANWAPKAGAGSRQTRVHRAASSLSPSGFRPRRATRGNGQIREAARFQRGWQKLSPKPYARAAAALQLSVPTSRFAAPCKTWSMTWTNASVRSTFWSTTPASRRCAASTTLRKRISIAPSRPI